ncbi:MAG TPA: hypothetical protein VF808_18915 [Ktedonobacterales bacterium]
MLTVYTGLYFAEWAICLHVDPAVALHLEDGERIVIVEGQMRRFTPDRDLATRLNQSSLAKYAVSADPSAEPEAIWRLLPQTVLVWTRFPADATRFHF